MIKIAVFGDLHGRILLAFYLVKKWQKENNSKIDYILCTGDVGIFRGYDWMDKSSRRFADKYPEELGFSKFFLKRVQSAQPLKLVKDPVAENLMNEVDCKLYFVPGNHEEHQYIGRIKYQYARDYQVPFAVDIDWDLYAEGGYDDDEFYGYDRIYCLPEGPVVSLPGPLSEKTWEPEFNIHIRAINGLQKYTMPDAWNSVTPGSVDILLTHETYKGRLKGFDQSGKRDEFGSEKLHELIKKLGPPWHFFGHHHYYYPEINMQSELGTDIHSVGLNPIFFKKKNSIITQGSFGILTITQTDRKLFDFSIVDDEWFRGLRFTDVSSYL